MKNEDYFVLFKRPNGIWYYYVYRWGKKVRRSTGERKRTDAMKVALQRRDKGDLLNDRAHTVWTTFAEFSEPFWIWETCPIIRDKVERGGHFSKMLAKSNRQNTDKYLIPAFGSRVLQEISPAMIKIWLRGIPSKYGVTPQTANKQLTMLRQMLDVAVEEQVLPSNPARAVKPLIPKESERGCFTLQQVQALFSEHWPNRYIEAMCRLAALTGMRLGEVQGLCFDQIRNDTIDLDRSWAKMEGLKTPKSGKNRYVPIPSDLTVELRSFLHQGDLIFTLDGEHPIDATSVRYALRKRMDECGIDWQAEKLSFHSFRHFANSHLLDAGLQGESVRAVIGHSSARMTQRYNHLQPETCDRIRIIQEAI